MNPLVRWLVLLILACWSVCSSVPAFSEDTVPTNSLSRLFAGDPVQIQGRLQSQDSAPVTSDAVKSLLESPEAGWEPQSGSVNFGFLDERYQFRFRLTNDLTTQQAVLLNIAYPVLDYVDVFWLRSGEVGELLSGDRRPFGQRLIDHPEFLVPLIFDPGETIHFVAEVQTQGSLQFPLQVWQADAYLERTTTEQKLHFFYFGLMTVTILFTLIMFVMFREPSYLFYALAAIGYLLFFSGIRGFSSQHLWPDSPILNMRVFLISMPLLALFSLVFARRFLTTPVLTPRWNWLITAMIVLESINLVIACVAPYNEAVRLSALLASPLWLVLILAGPMSGWRARKAADRPAFRAAMYFSSAWFLLTMGMVITMLYKAGLLPYSMLTEYGMQVGSALEALLLTFGLADRFYQEREEKIRMQGNLLEESRQRRNVQQKLIEYALHDLTTGLPNRALFEMKLQELMQEGEPEIFVSVIWFRKMRDIAITLGDKNTEEILRSVASELNTRASQLNGMKVIEHHEGRNFYVCALSGDRLGMIADAQACRQEKTRYEDMLTFLKEPRMHLDFQIELQPVMGVSVGPAQGIEPATLLRKAQIAVEQASQNTIFYAFYREAVDDYDFSRLTLMTDLRQAIRSDQTELYYQPKVDAKTHAVMGVEALMRWKNGESGWIPPDRFVSVAETTDLIHQLTFWVIERGLRDLRELRAAGHPLTLSLNLSARNLSVRNLEVFLVDSLKRNGLTPQDVVLELTETAMMQEPEEGIRVLQRFRETGFAVAMDDFGAGYSSLSYLKQMPVQEIKIDKALVQEISSSESARLILQATVTMCHNLGFRVVAEGVETAAEAECLRQMNCDALQGYYFARPMPKDALLEWLVKNPPAG